MRILPCIIAASLLIVPPLHGQSPDRRAVLEGIDRRAKVYGDVAMQIWGFAEVGYQETRSSALLQEQLRAAGFTVKAASPRFRRRSPRSGEAASR
jgi:aminobenzoyl-glutamate utilization protein B